MKLAQGRFKWDLDEQIGIYCIRKSNTLPYIPKAPKQRGNNIQDRNRIKILLKSTVVYAHWLWEAILS